MESSNSSNSSNFLDTTSSDGSDGRRRPVLCARQKMALFAKTGYSDERALEIGIDIDMDFMKEHGVTAVNVRSAKLTCLDLKALGLASALGLRELGFDALDLNNPSFCASAVAAFGAQDVTRTFLLDAGDATALAGSVAIHHLQLTTQRLLESCAGSPEQAKAVLQQTSPRGGALVGVSPVTLLDTGLRAAALCSLGYFSNNVGAQTKCSHEHIKKLGF